MKPSTIEPHNPERGLPIECAVHERCEAGVAGVVLIGLARRSVSVQTKRRQTGRQSGLSSVRHSASGTTERASKIMYRIPSDLDLSPVVGEFTTQLRVGQFDLQFTFVKVNLGDDRNTGETRHGTAERGCDLGCS
jgi:hypothetical protein